MMRMGMIAFVIAGCSSSQGSSGDEGSAKLQGTIAGATPVVLDAIAFNKDSLLTLKLTDYAGACELEAMNNSHKASSHYIELYLTSYPGAVGSLPLDGEIAASYFTRDATCSGDSISAETGSVAITEVTADHVVGSFDLTFDGERVTGTFDAPVCDGGAVVGSGGTCVP